MSSMNKRNALLDLITSNEYIYINTPLSKKEFFDILEFAKNNCFTISENEREDKWEYRYELEFIYNSKAILLKRFKSYTSDEEYFLLRCEK